MHIISAGASYSDSLTSSLKSWRWKVFHQNWYFLRGVKTLKIHLKFARCNFKWQKLTEHKCTTCVMIASNRKSILCMAMYSCIKSNINRNTAQCSKWYLTVAVIISIQMLKNLILKRHTNEEDELKKKPSSIPWQHFLFFTQLPEMLKKRSLLIKNYYFVSIAFYSIFYRRFSNWPNNLHNRRNDEIRAN